MNVEREMDSQFVVEKKLDPRDTEGMCQEAEVAPVAQQGQCRSERS